MNAELSSGLSSSSALFGNESAWVSGHCPVSGGAGQVDRQLQVLASVPYPPPDLALHFRVPAYTRRGNYFDLESLGYVVLAGWRHDLSRAPKLVKRSDPIRPDSLWLTMSLGDDCDSGVRIRSERPSQPSLTDVALDLAIADPPTLSIRGTTVP